ncbi:hypothetical protein OFN33_32060, partial [Escherichia coli]|nr:hypothetical protein [Escherichia coli]
LSGKYERAFAASKDSAGINVFAAGQNRTFALAPDAMNVRQSDCYYFFLSQLSSAAIRNCLLLWHAGPIPKTFPFMDSVV